MDSSSEGAWIRRLLDVGRALMTELDLEAVLERVLLTARELTGARYAALGILGDQRSELERFLTSGIDKEEARRTIGDLPRGRGVLGALIKQPHPLRLTDVGQHPSSYGFPAGHPVMRSFLGVPIVSRVLPEGHDPTRPADRALSQGPDRRPTGGDSTILRNLWSSLKQSLLVICPIGQQNIPGHRLVAAEPSQAANVTTLGSSPSWNAGNYGTAVNSYHRCNT